MNPFGISDSLFEQLSEQRRQESFLYFARNPKAWVRRGFLHKRGADILYDVSYEASKRDLQRTFDQIENKPETKSGPRTLEGDELEDYLDTQLSQEYLLLMGYAFECVL